MATWWNNGGSAYRQLIHSRKWRELRKRKLSESVWCEDCLLEDRHELATEVHHEIPVLQGSTLSHMASLAYDIHNLRALCHSCHVRRHKIRPTPKEQAQEVAKRAKNDFVARYFGE